MKSLSTNDEKEDEAHHATEHHLNSTAPKVEQVKEHLATGKDAIKALHIYFPDKEEVDEKDAEKPKAKDEVGKKTLVMDMDETMVHTAKSQSLAPENDFEPDFSLFIQPDNVFAPGCKFSTFYRPGIRDFLKQLAPHYEIVLFTAGEKIYADAVVEDLLKGPPNANGLFEPLDDSILKTRFYREDATVKPPSDPHMGSYYYYWKDLQKTRADRDVRKVLLVDDKKRSFLTGPQEFELPGHTPDTFTVNNSLNFNAVYIPPFDKPQEMQKDTSLKELIPFLIKISKGDDVRTELDARKTFKEQLNGKNENGGDDSPREVDGDDIEN